MPSGNDPSLGQNATLRHNSISTGADLNVNPGGVNAVNQVTSSGVAVEFNLRSV